MFYTDVRKHTHTHTHSDRLTHTVHQLYFPYAADGMICPLLFRALYIIDDKGNLRQITMNDLPVGRSVDETLRLVQAFQFTDKHGEGEYWSVLSSYSHISLCVLGLSLCVVLCVCVCVDGMNLKYALRWHIHISVHSVLCQYAPSNHLRTANLQAKSGYCQ